MTSLWPLSYIEGLIPVQNIADEVVTALCLYPPGDARQIGTKAVKRLILRVLDSETVAPLQWCIVRYLRANA